MSSASENPCRGCVFAISRKLHSRDPNDTFSCGLMLMKAQRNNVLESTSREFESCSTRIYGVPAKIDISEDEFYEIWSADWNMPSVRPGHLVPETFLVVEIMTAFDGCMDGPLKEMESRETVVYFQKTIIRRINDVAWQDRETADKFMRLLSQEMDNEERLSIMEYMQTSGKAMGQDAMTNAFAKAFSARSSKR